MSESKEKEAPLIPESAIQAVNKTLTNTEDLKAQLQEFLALADPDVLSHLSPLQRAQSLLLVAMASTTLVALKLRCNGVNPNDHPVKTELERLNLYEDKLQRAIALSKAPLRRSTTLNSQAATRFIEHSLPDLSNEQRKNMRDISKGEATRSREQRNAIKKRKVHSESKSVRAAAQEFLEKATLELLGANNGVIKGPLRPETSNEEDQLMD